MKKYRLPTIAFVVIGSLNLLAFTYVAGHPEYLPATDTQDSNVPAQVPAWIGHMS